jgi:hypothetical protein
MAAVLASPTGSLLSGHSFYGSLDFLNDRLRFNLLFPNPTPVLLSLSHPRNPTVDSTTDAAPISQLVDRCKFEFFLPCFELTMLVPPTATTLPPCMPPSKT